MEPSELEQELSPVIQKIIDAGGTGYRWGDADAVARRVIGIKGTRFYRVTEGGRVYNLGREMKTVSDLIVVVLELNGFSIDDVVGAIIGYAPQREGLPPTIVLMTKQGKTWRGVRVLQRKDVPATFDVKKYFPGVGDAERLPEPKNAGSGPQKITAIAPEEFAELLHSFSSYAEASGLRYTQAVLLDALACVLATQLVLFAGPSGSGKSTLADLLMTFFAPEDLRRRLPVRRGMERPEDFTGSFSPYGGFFASTTYTADLRELGAAAAGSDPTPPFVLLEEANLSAMDGYLAPVIHELSAPSHEAVVWELYDRGGISGDTEELAVPEQVVFAPFSRWLATVNVDADAPAPTRKVASRSAVLLLEPEVSGTAVSLVDSAVDSQTRAAARAAYSGKGAGYVVDPGQAFFLLGVEDRKQHAAALDTLIAAMFPDRTWGVGSRTYMQALYYMAWYVGLAPQSVSGPVKLAAENAVLHYLLPDLQPAEFSALLDRVGDLPLAPAGDDTSVGGLLRPRLERLAAARTGPLATLQSIDFWEALA